MSVAKFCTCGFQLGHPRPNCPACGRSLEMSTSNPVLTAVPLPVPPLTLEPLKFEPENKRPRPHWNDVDTYLLNEPNADNAHDRLYEDQIAEARRLLREARRRQRSIVIFFAEPGSLKDCFFYPFKGWVWATLLAFGWAIILVLLTALMPLEQFGVGTVSSRRRSGWCSDSRIDCADMFTNRRAKRRRACSVGQDSIRAKT